MTKKVAGIVVLVVILGSAVALLFLKNPAKAPSNSSTATSNSSNTTNMNHSESSDVSIDSTPVATNVVEIKDYAYAPDVITIKKGTTVTWTNQDTTRHNIAPDEGTTDFKASKLLAKGESYSVTFNTVGTFSYYCTPHPYMKGKVIVAE